LPKGRTLWGPCGLYYIYIYLCNKELVLCYSLFTLSTDSPLSTAIERNTLSALSQGEIREGKVEEHAVLDKNNKIDLHINSKVWNIPFPCAYAVCAKFCTLLMIQCWRRSPLVKPQCFHQCMRSLNAVCKCKMCTSAFSMDGQRWFRCRWWSVDSPLHPRRHRRRCLPQDRLHRPPWMSIWRHHHRLRPLQRQLLVIRHLHQCLWSSRPLLPVVDSPREPSMLHVDALSSLAIAQMEWPRLPPPTGGTNGPRFGRRVGRSGGGGGERRGKPRHGHALRSRAGARRGLLQRRGRGSRPRQGRSARAPRGCSARPPPEARAREQAPARALGAAPEGARRGPPRGRSARPHPEARAREQAPTRALGAAPEGARRGPHEGARRGPPAALGARQARAQEEHPAAAAGRRQFRLANAPGAGGGYRGRLGLETLAAPI
jgi:hypothetical protein